MVPSASVEKVSPLLRHVLCDSARLGQVVQEPERELAGKETVCPANLAQASYMLSSWLLRLVIFAAWFQFTLIVGGRGGGGGPGVGGGRGRSAGGEGDGGGGGLGGGGEIGRAHV